LRLTTARYYTPSGRSIQAKGIDPTVVVEEELPEEMKKKADSQNTRGESNLRGHLKGEHENDDADDANDGADGAGVSEEGEKEEESGSSSYVPQDKEKDTQLNYALDLLRGIKSVDTEAKKKAEAN
jgi:carboxyl-terminal processing protease